MKPVHRARPESTYRLQFHKGFTFRDATAIVPYLASLGVTHAYASPYLKAAPGSTHGYDVIDHCTLNPEVGTTAEYDQWVAVLTKHGLAHILDTVPNHVGVATNENKWWNDVLENGRASLFADYFDIAWEGAARAELRNKVLLPLLGTPYGEALEKGELRLSYENGALAVNYYARRFPLSPRSYREILSLNRETLIKAIEPNCPEAQEYDSLLAAIANLPDGVTVDQAMKEERHADKEFIKQRLGRLVDRCKPLGDLIAKNLSEINGTSGDPGSFDRLDELLNKQNFRLAYWRVAPDEINYRRFFDINDLAALRMENPKVFEATHRFIFSLIERGKVTGLRIDHPDGLYDPLRYLRELQAHFNGEKSEDGRPPLHVTVEKILAADEPLPLEWPVDGTTGYDFLNKINGLFVDGRNESAFTKLYENWTGDAIPFEEIVYRKKLLILDFSLASELHMLARYLDAVAQGNRRSRDFTLGALREALRQIIACFPVYRSYIADGKMREADRPFIQKAIEQAIKRNPAATHAVYEFLADVLTLKYPANATDKEQQLQQKFVGKFQQLTAPTTAKGIEDTAFYIYHRFISLNEVGGDPDRFGVAAEDVHRYLADRAKQWPYGLSPLSTHDTKRSEDVRARLNVLSELPEEWKPQVEHWSQLNRRHKTIAPDRGEEYLIYQTVLGALPLDGNIADGFVERIQAYLLKAMREAKVNTSWTTQNEKYEAAAQAFVAAILDRARSGEFIDLLTAFARRISRWGLMNSLSQTLLRLTAPGVPDTYQGTELWDFSLVDPDNRRPVDYNVRRSLESSSPTGASELLAAPADGRIKLFLTSRALHARRENPGLFTHGKYVPLKVEGERADHLFAFARRHEGRSAVVIAPKWFSRLAPHGEGLAVPASAWDDTRLVGLSGSMRNVLTGEKLVAEQSMSVGKLLAGLPVGLWMSE